MANMQTAAQGAPVMDEAAMTEMRRLIFEAPIQELADAQGISVDEAVQLRVEKNLEAAEVPIEVSVRPIEPQGKLIGFASVNIGGIVIDDFKVVRDLPGGAQQTRSHNPDGLPLHSAGDKPGLAGAAERGGGRRLQHGRGKADCPRRGPASKADPGADGKRGKGGRKGKRHPARPGKGQGGQG